MKKIGTNCQKKAVDTYNPDKIYDVLHGFVPFIQFKKGGCYLTKFYDRMNYDSRYAQIYTIPRALILTMASQLSKLLEYEKLNTEERSMTFLIN